tara:strand:- start:662 stop:862 length:201 start_codon:yes stop_codon:yes gene_type:complete
MGDIFLRVIYVIAAIVITLVITLFICFSTTQTRWRPPTIKELDELYMKDEKLNPEIVKLQEDIDNE